jgi:serralysin
MTTPTTSSSVSNVPLTGFKTIDALLEGSKWSSRVITYSIPTINSVWSTSESTGYGSTTGPGEPWSTQYDVFTSAEATRFRTALAQWSNVSGLQFIEMPDMSSLVGDIRVAYTWMDSAEAWAYAPHQSPVGGDIWINSNSNSYHSTFAAGSYAYLTMLHEIGHALGLKHPHEASESIPATLASSQDTLAYTLMSYFSSPANQNTYLSFYPTTPMVLDIQAIQSLYGKDKFYNWTDTTYSYKDDSTYLETIWDAGGTNTIAYGGTKAATIDLREGSGSRMGIEVYVRNLSGANIDTVSNVWIAYGTRIHNATSGTGNDVITGNDLDNILTGGGGNDSISGAGGNDRIILSGTGTSTVDGGADLDTLVLSGTRSSYNISSSNTGHLIAGTMTGAASITESNIERVLFADSAVAFDVSGTAGQAYRLYQAAFDRKPDLGGLGYWIATLEKGASLLNIAGAFTTSQEFKNLYGASPTTAELVTLLYNNVLDRAPDSGGFKHWTNLLDTKQLTVMDVIVGFSESVENKAALTGSMSAGMEFNLWLG